MSKLIDQVCRAKLTGAPYVCITTSDPENLAATLSEAVSKILDEKIAEGNKVEPITALRWDVSRGFHTGSTEDHWDVRGKQWIAERTKKPDSVSAAFGQEESKSPGAGQPCPALEMLQEANENTLVFFIGANRWLHIDDTAGKSAVQAAANLRTVFERGRARGSMLILLAPEITLPEELRGDTILVDDPLPTPEDIIDIFNTNKVLAEAEPNERAQRKAAASMTGCSMFGARQAMYMACKRKDTKLYMDHAELREFRHRQIEQTRGLKVIPSRYDMSYVAGHKWTKDLFTQIMNGNDPPNGFINVEEINLALSGSYGDNTGVSQDQVMVLLDTMEKRGDEGVIFFGVPGCSKSWIVECLGKTYDVDVLQLDLNGLKSEHVGSSEQNIRQALKVADAVCGGRKLWIATCNSVTEISDALMRRFTFGIVYFDLLSEEEKQNVWKIQLGIYGERLGDKTKWKKLTQGWEKIPTELWSGADIRNCCRHAYRRNLPVVEVAKEANPVTRQSPDMLPKYRKQAHNCYRESNTGKIYREPSKQNDDKPYAEKERLSLV